MGVVLDEMNAILNGESPNELKHYGMPRRSGRYPYGSGDNPYQRTGDFLSRVEELKKNGWQETPDNIKKEFGLTTTRYRTEKAVAKDERRMYDVATAKRLRDKEGLGATEIGRRMGKNESSIRTLLDEKVEERTRKAFDTADFLKKRLDEVSKDGGMIDVGKGVERELRISKEKMDEALLILQSQGYEVYGGRFEQVTNRGKFTTQTVLCPPGTPHSKIYELDKVHTVKEYISRDGGETFEKKFTYPESMDSKRLKIRYNEEGGLEKDGVIELRRGVEDLSLGESRYSQVRILVDGTHYLKGMAVYSDNMPDGVDVVFNTNKKKGTPMTSVLKEIKEDPDNPFGSAIKDAEQGGQYWYTDSKTGKKKLGLINKRADEGDWTEWKDALPSQFLAKQSKALVDKQLNLAKADKVAEYEEIMSLTNPTVKKYYLEKFANECDSAAVHLKAAALPGQKYHVIVPINSLKDNEVYAPGYDPGTKLALIRYPHGGTFEIPILTVNNKNTTANKIIGKQSIDAIGINKTIADRLSGADFDGDTVMCIPTNGRNNKIKITSTPPLKGLEGFDPTEKYGPDTYKGRNVKIMSKKYTQTQMGVISNLITDMTLAGADDDELAAAVRHSMVVIDANKHKLDYRQSEMDNNISALHKKYQGKATGGAATILSRAKGEASVPKRKGSPHVNIKGTKWYDPNKPEGSLVYTLDDNATYTITKTNKRTGEVTTTTKARMQKSTNMAETDDAYTLVSKARHPKELAYADYANTMKSMANKARLDKLNAGKVAYDANAKRIYSTEVNSIMNKLDTALLNAPRERAAARMANAEVTAKYKSGQIDKSDLKKASQQATNKYRQEVGSVTRKQRNIVITDKEWEAIQAGAISETKLKQVLDNCDPASLREKAMPKTSSSLSSGQIARMKAMSSSDFTIAQIASKFGVSPSTVSKYLKGVK